MARALPVELMVCSAPAREKSSVSVTPHDENIPKAPAAIVVTAPLEMSIFFSDPPAENAMKRLSGDQNGANAPSVPDNGSRRDGVERTQPQ